MEFRLATAAPLFAFDDELNVVAWNEAAEQLTGIASADAIGRPCWDVLAGQDDGGGMVCHKHCSRGRLAREGWPLGAQEMNIRCADGRRRVAVDTVSALDGERPLFLHLMRDAPAAAPLEQPPADLDPPPRLTPRQLDVLRLLAEGTAARAIAVKLGLTEPTVRNHIRATLLELGAHSQLEAVFRARCCGLV
ncbi:MAG TPA: LuxR C-terminal-related transcriptional regulator [Gaiellaceae bacterium]|jgi:PAS domain S-box-containing protein|nr:LuxR C-terminal-related transcriptional regulator [Gaiellaceae bacterium]